MTGNRSKDGSKAEGQWWLCTEPDGHSPPTRWALLGICLRHQLLLWISITRTCYSNNDKHLTHLTPDGRDLHANKNSSGLFLQFFSFSIKTKIFFFPSTISSVRKQKTFSSPALYGVDFPAIPSFYELSHITSILVWQICTLSFPNETVPQLSSRQAVFLESFILLSTGFPQGDWRIITH